MRILVTGARGFVAGHLVPALVADGHEIFGVVRPGRSARASDGVSAIKCDLAAEWDEASLPPVDTIVHLAQAATGSGSGELYRVNTLSTLRLLEHGRRTGCRRFVLASSGAVYGRGPAAFAETDPLRPDGLYALTKAHAEQLVEAFRPFFETTILRLFFPYGPGLARHRLIADVLDRVAAGRPLTLRGGGQTRINPVYVGDVVDVVRDVIGSGGPDVVNVSGDDVCGLRELGEIAGEVVGSRPLFEALAEEGVGDLVGDNARMHTMLGESRLVPLREGMRLMAGAA